MRRSSLPIPSQFNVSQYFLDRNLGEGRGSRVAVGFGEQELTYGQVVCLVGQAGNLFSSSGVKRRDRVMLLLRDSPAFVAAFWGAIRLGAIPVPVNTLLAPEEYEFILRDSGARNLVVDDALLGKITPFESRLKHLNATWVVGEAPQGYASFEKGLANSSPDFSPAPTHRDDPAFWLYTSGSTGRPKAAIHRHRDMVVCLERYAKQVLGMSAKDRTFSTSKLFFAYGLGNGLYFPFGVGASTVLLAERPSADNILEVLRRYQPTIFFSVPALYAALLQVPDADPNVFHSLRCAVSAGEALPATLGERFRNRFGIAIVDGIGSTEMLHMFISNRPGDIVSGSSGKPVPGYEVKIVNEQGEEVAPGQMGDLLVRGQSSAAGYWRRPELTRRTFRTGWTATGDRYTRDQSGYFWYQGRSDDMLKVSGMWVSPLEVENALINHPAVTECAVVGVTDREGLTKPKAFVVLKDSVPSSVETEAELFRFLKGRLPGYKAPRWIVFVQDLPRTATGKIQRYKLREMAISSSA